MIIKCDLFLPQVVPLLPLSPSGRSVSIVSRHFSRIDLPSEQSLGRGREIYNGWTFNLRLNYMVSVDWEWREGTQSEIERDKNGLEWEREREEWVGSNVRERLFTVTHDVTVSPVYRGREVNCELYRRWRKRTVYSPQSLSPVYLRWEEMSLRSLMLPMYFLFLIHSLQYPSSAV